MAYYQNAPGKKTKVNYGETGSWDEEGTHYRNGKQNRSASRDGKYERRKFGENGQRDGNRSTYRPNNRRDRSQSESRGRTERRVPQPQEEPRDWRDYEYRAPRPEEGRENSGDNILCGRNPIREALRSGRDIEKILVAKGELSASAREIVNEAREKKIMVQETDRRRMDEIALHHQGLIAFASAYAYAEVEDILAEAEKRKEAPFIILLDGVTDPHNLGAVIRTAECVGAHGVIIPQHRSVGLTPAAVKASAGAIEHMKVAKVTNLNRTIEELQRQGVWTYAVTMDGKDYEKVDFRGGVALVIGAEGEGIARLTAEKCDLKVSLPMKGKIDSLNASVAAGIVMYRVLSCRRKG